MRDDGRAADEMRKVVIETGYQKYPDGSVLICCGETKVICSAFVEKGVPRFLLGSEQGWVTAEYSMLPGAGQTRTKRERSVKGRSHEIQRLIGRSLRAVVDLRGLGEQTINVDCDVLQADGGTRTAAITGAFVAMVLAMARLREMGLLGQLPVIDTLEAVSCGMVEGEPRLDLHYHDDYRADVDMNVVMTGRKKLIEVQGTAEGEPYDREQLDTLLDLATAGCSELGRVQREALGDLYDEIVARHG